MWKFQHNRLTLVGGFSPTHLKNMRTVKLDDLPRDRGENSTNKTYFSNQPTSSDVLPLLSVFLAKSPQSRVPSCRREPYKGMSYHFKLSDMFSQGW